MLLLLFHPRVTGTPTPTPTPSPAPTATPLGDGGAWGRASSKRRRRLRDEDREIQAAVGALGASLMFRKFDTDADVERLIRELAPEFMKNRKRLN
jgi:hypothetical protein